MVDTVHGAVALVVCGFPGGAFESNIYNIYIVEPNHRYIKDQATIANQILIGLDNHRQTNPDLETKTLSNRTHK